MIAHYKYGGQKNGKGCESREIQERIQIVSCNNFFINRTQVQNHFPAKGFPVRTEISLLKVFVSLVKFVVKNGE